MPRPQVTAAIAQNLRSVTNKSHRLLVFSVHYFENGSKDVEANRTVKDYLSSNRTVEIDDLDQQQAHDPETRLGVLTVLCPNVDFDC
jgi:hypothetical protein